LVADNVPCVHVIANGLRGPYVPASVVGVAVDAQLAAPVTPLVASVSPALKPLNVAVNVGFEAPYVRDASSAVTVRCALLMKNEVGGELLP
jgi:hypothetical protein